MMTMVTRRRVLPRVQRAMRMSSMRMLNMTMRRKASTTMKITARRTACLMLNSAKERSDLTVSSIN